MFYGWKQTIATWTLVYDYITKDKQNKKDDFNPCPQKKICLLLFCVHCSGYDYILSTIPIVLFKESTHKRRHIVNDDKA